MPTINDPNRLHNRRMDQYIRRVAMLYGVTIDEAVAMVRNKEISPDKAFSFDDFPDLKRKANKTFGIFAASLLYLINTATETEWKKACDDVDAVIDSIAKATKIATKQFEGYGKRNIEALAAFQKRKIGGMNLSDRVWNLTDQFKQELELALDIGIGEGRSAAELSRDVRQYLNEPERLFRRVRDKHGNLALSKKAKAYHPGAGVNRSSFKNARRMTATETNMAYRKADNMRWQQLAFVVGIEVKLSNNHTINGVPFTDICDDLAGKYPKTFVFTGWHPLCRCYAVPILFSKEEMMERNRMKLAGEDVSGFKSKNAVDDVPENFKKWVNDNADRIEKANNRGTLPWFLKDNATFAGISVKDINLTNRAEYIREAKAKFDSYDSNVWTKEYFDKFSGGFNVYHQNHIFSKKGGGGEAEKTVGKMLAKYNGKQVQFLPEGRVKEPDILFDNKTWEIKYINDANVKTVRSYLEDAREKNADNAIFYWDNNANKIEFVRAALESERGKLLKLGRLDELPDIYYMDKSGLLKLFWKK